MKDGEEDQGKTGKGKKVSLIKNRYDESPFTSAAGFVVPHRKKRGETANTGEKQLTIRLGDEVVPAEIRMLETVDSEPFVKIFTGELSRFFGLNPAALRIVTVMLENLGKMKMIGGDQVYLTERDVAEAMIENDIKPMSSATYYRAIEELISKGFIAPSSKPPLYFINPAIFFNGDRIKFVREIRVRQGAKSLEDTLRQQRDEETNREK